MVFKADKTCTLTFSNKYEVVWFQEVINEPNNIFNACSGYIMSFYIKEELTVDDLKEYIISSVKGHRIKSKKIKFKAVIYGIYNNTYRVYLDEITFIYNKNIISILPKVD